MGEPPEVGGTAATFSNRLGPVDIPRIDLPSDLSYLLPLALERDGVIVRGEFPRVAGLVSMLPRAGPAELAAVAPSGMLPVLEWVAGFFTGPKPSLRNPLVAFLPNTSVLPVLCTLLGAGRYVDAVVVDHADLLDATVVALVMEVCRGAGVELWLVYRHPPAAVAARADELEV